MTPDQLAFELGISPKTLRAWLRKQYPLHHKNDRWDLDGWMVLAAVRQFGFR